MPELADVLRRHGPEYRRRFCARLPHTQRRALHAITACRTPANGGHLYRCGQCAATHFGFHSCHHRSCPKCGGADAQAWGERHQRDLLPVPYFLITFTVPEELRALFQRQPHLGYSVLFAESAGTLQEIAANPRHLGAELGFIGVLHTWTEEAVYGTSGGRRTGENANWVTIRTCITSSPAAACAPMAASGASAGG